MGITVKDIATHCGVSRITVDRALNGRPGVSEEKRQEILCAAKLLGYHPHYLARSLVKGKSNSIGLMLFDLANPTFAEIAQVVEKAAQKLGLVTYIMLTESDPEKEQACLDHLVSRQVDGILMYTVRKDEEYIQQLKQTGIPVITLMNKLADDIPHVGIDNRLAMFDITRYVLNKGYERLFFVSPPLRHEQTQNIYTLTQRLEGHLAALASHGQGRESIVIGDKSYLRQLNELDDLDRIKTAVMCTSDIYALEISGLMTRRGLRTPWDFGISGFDNIRFLQYFDPAFTTVSVPNEEIGQRALDILGCLLRGEDVPAVELVGHQTVIGQTIA